ncbi:arginase family protein [Enterocloster bolteae]|uniref:arginase family protein n=1 Tax=Enterocloster bolteae TaxID=208479 RepID=UPI00210D772F|nr:arginase family protein [Enterocloster bolteae]MCQ5146031.1 arginase family protein [Enterocloster bolteae]
MSKSTTLRLLMPQWQGGDVPNAYPLGARLTQWLAPKTDAVTVEVPTIEPDGSPRTEQDGIVERRNLMRQLHSAQDIINAYSPERVVVFGGDCLVEQGPISYLNKRYEGELGVLWMDAHPDVTTPKEFNHAHTMVLGNLLGDGDTQFAAEVPVKLKSGHVMFAGLQETTDQETEYIKEKNLRYARPEELSDNSSPILEWIREAGIKKMYIHLDLDVLDPGLFRNLLFSNPMPDPENCMDFSMGAMNFAQVTRVLKDVSAHADVVGMGITEQLPWDAINLKDMLSEVPVLNS